MTDKPIWALTAEERWEMLCNLVDVAASMWEERGGENLIITATTDDAAVTKTILRRDYSARENADAMKGHLTQAMSETFGAMLKICRNFDEVSEHMHPVTEEAFRRTIFGMSVRDARRFDRRDNPDE